MDCNGKVLDLTTPVVMGILNITPDSFFDGGKYTDEQTILTQVQTMITEGATIIDVGAVSTRPGADEVSEEEELKRLIGAIRIIRKNYSDLIISVDTCRASVAKEAIRAGADMINDISGGEYDPNMFATIAELQVPYVLMHMQGTPRDMQQNPQYTDVVKEVYLFFKHKAEQLTALGVRDIILDPGFGFGKTLKHNYQLLKHLSLFSELGYPILVGVSRKSMINKVLGTTPDCALNGTTALHTLAIMNGARILRVHDVLEAREVVKLMNMYSHSS
ncbi:MAG TPA: dihydropteroate synthase [Candidatus Magasanikbacteria bacterium]|nr:dihydropteroate synthase [Candidatus Magasanikbacteria bacterium]